jgi:hypothetical protein
VLSKKYLCFVAPESCLCYTAPTLCLLLFRRRGSRCHDMTCHRYDPDRSSGSPGASRPRATWQACGDASTVTLSYCILTMTGHPRVCDMCVTRVCHPRVCVTRVCHLRVCVTRVCHPRVSPACVCHPRVCVTRVCHPRVCDI